MDQTAAPLSPSWTQGTLVTWHDDRGFGFIRPASGGRDIFVHVRELHGSPFPPAVGQVITYETARQPDGRDRAVRVLLAETPGASARAAPASASRSTPAPRRRGRRALSRTLQVVVPLAAGAGVVAVLNSVWPVPSWVAWVYVVMSLLTYRLYAKDKTAALRNLWRVPEARLHWFAVLGGWPGALLAQQVLRHKTVKASFRGVFWFTVVANLSLLAALCSPTASPHIDSLINSLRNFLGGIG